MNPLWKVNLSLWMRLCNFQVYTNSRTQCLGSLLWTNNILDKEPSASLLSQNYCWYGAEQREPKEPTPTKSQQLVLGSKQQQHVKLPINNAGWWETLAATLLSCWTLLPVHLSVCLSIYLPSFPCSYHFLNACLTYPASIRLSSSPHTEYIVCVSLPDSPWCCDTIYIHLLIYCLIHVYNMFYCWSFIFVEQNDINHI